MMPKSSTSAVDAPARPGIHMHGGEIDREVVVMTNESSNPQGTGETMMSTKVSMAQRTKLVLLGVVMLACASLSGQVLAQAAVVDLPHTLKTSFGWVAQYEQMISDYKQQVKQYETLQKQVDQLKVNGDTYSGKPGYREMFQERDVNFGVDKRCTQRRTKNPPAPEQYDYCIAIVQTENRRFNALVKMLKDVNTRDKELRGVLAEREDIDEDEQGKLESNTNRVLSLQSQLQNDVQNAQTLRNTYDVAIRTLKDEQIQAGNAALAGKSSLLGNATQGVALKLALKAARMRDR